MKHNSKSVMQRNFTRLLVTLAAICLPIIAVTFISGSFFRTGTLRPIEVANAAGVHTAMHMQGGDMSNVLVSETGTPPSGCTPSTDISISITESGFSPSSITVSPATRVTWTNNGMSRHRVRDINHSLFDSSDLQPGQSFSYIFCNLGTYNYEDARTGFTAVIIVSGTQATNTPGSTATQSVTPGTTATEDRTVTPGITSTSQATATPGGGNIVDVQMQRHDVYVPSDMTISTGTTVRWANADEEQHTTTSDTGVWNSGALNAGQGYEFTFLNPGTYTYACLIHSEMRGTITVTGQAITPTPGGATSTPQATPTPGGGNIDVSIQNFAFQPQNLTVLVGTTVRWTNADSFPHTSSCDTGVWNSGILNQGQSFQYTFNTVGNYTYHCDVHPGMNGNITVVSSGGGTATATLTAQATNTVQATNTAQATASPTGTAIQTAIATGTAQATNTTTPQVVNVSIQTYAYNPRTITIPAGTTVRWTNLDNDQHSVTSADNPRAFDSGEFGLNGTWDFMFNTPGTYNYFCTVHGTFMSGTVIVQSGASTATATSTSTVTAEPTQTTEPTNTAQVSDTPEVTATETATVETTATPIDTPTTQPTNTPNPQAVDVSIQHFAFQPQNLTVSVGTTVRWTNLDAMPHTATSDANVWNSGLLYQGQSFHYTFDAAGTFAYHCELHSGMHGTITVTDGGGSTTTPTTTAQASETPQETNTPQDTPTNTTTELPTNTPAPHVVNVNIDDYAYSPRIITIPAGTTVHWTNLDSDHHSITHLGDPRLFDSGVFDRNHTWDYTFNTPGTYNYFCTVHGTFMSGTVIVQEAPTATPTRVAGQIFDDVTTNDYFYSAVDWLVSRNIVSGYSDGTFRPYANTTRGQVTKMVVLGEGWTIVTPQQPTFTDVTPSNVYFGFIETAVGHGILSGYSDGTFRPGSDVTRGQLAKIIVLARDWTLADPPTATFTNVPIGSAFFGFVETAVQHTIISGYSDGTFRPGRNAVRGQIAKIIYGALNAGQ